MERNVISMNGDVKTRRIYSRVYGFLYSEDLRNKYTNMLYPVMEKNIKENPENVRVFCKKIDEFVTSDRELAAAVVTMWLYDDKTKQIVSQNNADIICDIVMQRVKKRRMKE